MGGLRNDMESVGVFYDRFAVGDLDASGDSNKHRLCHIMDGYCVNIKAAILSTEGADVGPADTNYNTFHVKSGTYVGDPAATTHCTLANGPASTGAIITNDGTAMTINSSYIKASGSNKIVWLEQTKTGGGLAVPGAAVHLDLSFVAIV